MIISSPMGDYASSYSVVYAMGNAPISLCFRPLSGIMFLHENVKIRFVGMSKKFPSPVGDYASSPCLSIALFFVPSHTVLRGKLKVSIFSPFFCCQFAHRTTIYAMRRKLTCQTHYSIAKSQRPICSVCPL